MESGKSSSFESFKPKKVLHSPMDQQKGKILVPDPNPWSVQTPGKEADPPRRLSQRTAAMSIKEIRQAALMLRERGPGDKGVQGRSAGCANEGIDSFCEPASITAKIKKKSSKTEIKLPEKYELLDKFFCSLDSSIRLLQLKRTAATFSKVSTQVESLTDRRFTYSHLAQLKFIVPEVIEIEKVLQHDERTSCMKPDLRISLNVKAIELERNSKCDSLNLQLRKVFRSRLLDFFKSNPEVDEIPEEDLLEPFCRTKDYAIRNSVCGSASSSPFKSPCSENLKKEKSFLITGALVESFSDKTTNAFSVELLSECSSNGSSSIQMPPSSLLETPMKSTTAIKNEDGSVSVTQAVLRTPVENSTPAKLMCITPMLQHPKRCSMSPSDDPSASPRKLARRPRPNRPLKFDTPVKNAKVNKESNVSCNPSGDDDIFDILPEDLVQSIQEKEKKALMDHDSAISQSRWRQQMVACLPKLFDTIYYLLQSTRRSVITKEELIQKIIAGHLEVVDRKEVEDQLRLLQELAPEWIYEKSASCGDLLLCINKVSSPQAIRTRLTEAK